MHSHTSSLFGSLSTIQQCSTFLHVDVSYECSSYWNNKAISEVSILSLYVHLF